MSQELIWADQARFEVDGKSWPPVGFNADLVIAGKEVAIVRYPPAPRLEKFPWYAATIIPEWNDDNLGVLGYFATREDAIACAEARVRRQGIA